MLYVYCGWTSYVPVSHGEGAGVSEELEAVLKHHLLWSKPILSFPPVFLNIMLHGGHIGETNPVSGRVSKSYIWEARGE